MHDERLAAWIAASDILPNEVADVFLHYFNGVEETDPLEERTQASGSVTRSRSESQTMRGEGVYFVKKTVVRGRRRRPAKGREFHSSLQHGVQASLACFKAATETHTRAMGQSQGGQHPDLSALAVAGPSLHGRPEEQWRPVDGAALRQRGEVRDGLSLLLQAEEELGRRPLVRKRRTQSDARMRGNQHPSQTNGEG